jgi:hypothetical protein
MSRGVQGEGRGEERVYRKNKPKPTGYTGKGNNSLYLFYLVPIYTFGIIFDI